MAIKFNKLNLVAILATFSVLFLLSCQEGSLEPVFKTKLSYDELESKIVSNKHFLNLTNLLVNRQRQLTNTVYSINNQDYDKIASIRTKYTSYKALEVNGTKDEIEFFRNIFQKETSINEILETKKKLLESIDNNFSFDQKDFDRIIINRTNLLFSKTRVQGDCMSQCFDKGTDIYHGTYYTARWESGYTEEQAYAMAELVYSWYMVGCQDGCKGSQK